MDELCKRRVYQNYISAVSYSKPGKSKVGTVENGSNKKGGKSKKVGVASTKKKTKKTGKKLGKKAGKKTKKKTRVDGDKKLYSRQNDTTATADENEDRTAADENEGRPVTDPCPKKVCEPDDTIVEPTPCKGATLGRDSMEHLGRRHVRTAGDENGNCRRRVCDDSGETTTEGNLLGLEF